MIKLLIGGSPCTYWSIAQKNNRETEAEGLGWELFKNYLIAKEKFKPDFFLYENNKSAAQAIKDQISRELGVDLMYINSALVSAQNRQRFYAFNWEVEQPEDRGILLRGILESGVPVNVTKDNKSQTIKAQYQNTSLVNICCYKSTYGASGVAEPVGVTSDGKSYCPTATYGGACAWNTIERGQRSMVAEPIGLNTTRDGKAKCLMARCYKDGIRDMVANDIERRTCVAVPVCMRYERSEEAKILRKQYEKGEIHHGFHELSELHPRTDGKTNTLSTVLKDNPICEPVRVGGLPRPNGEISESQAMRACSINAKSINITSGGGGMAGKAGLYAIPVEFIDDVPVKAVSCADGKIYDVYEVKNGMITIKGKQYPIKLADGFYIIRKLTVTECCRLQTMPDDYCRAVSATQAYKGLGNGWTAEVIIHILNGALKDMPKDEEIVVLSMYDGIGTGRYCLDKMGFTNVKYYAYEIDKYAKQIAMSNYPDIIQMGDAFQVRETDWGIPCK